MFGGPQTIFDILWGHETDPHGWIMLCSARSSRSIELCVSLVALTEGINVSNLSNIVRHAKMSSTLNKLIYYILYIICPKP